MYSIAFTKTRGTLIQVCLGLIKVNYNALSVKGIVTKRCIYNLFITSNNSSFLRLATGKTVSSFICICPPSDFLN